MRKVEIKYFNIAKRCAVIKTFNEDKLIENYEKNVNDEDIVPIFKDKIYWCKVDETDVTASLKTKSISGIIRWLRENK